MRRSIIAGIDRSPQAVEAAPLAASLARRLDRRLVLAHVAHDPPAFPYGDELLREGQRRRATGNATGLLDAVARRLGEESARRRVALSGFVYGRLEDRLAALSRDEDADLLVVGCSTRGPLTRALVGSLSASIASSAACPVVAVPLGACERLADSATESPAPVICGVDGSPGAERASVVAKGIADQLGLPVLPVPAPALARAASHHDAALIVIGTRGRADLLSSVSGLAAIAPVPVVIVPPSARLPHFTATPTSVLAEAA
jgi:nucleotide-binding universal stress UspA family protein